MKKSEIVVGGHYLAKVSGNLVTVRVDAIRETEKPIYGARESASRKTPRTFSSAIYDVTNLKTGRRTTFRSAAKFRCPARGPANPSAAPCPTGDEADPCRPETEDSCSFAEPTATTAASATTSSSASPKIAPTTNTPCPRCGQSVPVTDGCYDYHRDPQKGGISCGWSGELVREDKQCSDPTKPASTSTEPKSGTTKAEPFTNPVSEFSNIETGEGTGEMPLRGLLAHLIPPNQPAPTGSKVAGYTPTAEQAAILEAGRRLQVHGQQTVLIVQAGAGTGKTSTDLMLEEVLCGRGQYTCFSRSLTDQARTKFKRAKVTSTYGLAFAQVGKLFAHRLNKGQRQRSSEVATFLGLVDLQLETGALDQGGVPVVKTLPAGKLAWQCTEAVRRFCQSADSELSERHFSYIVGLDMPGKDGKQTYVLNNQVSKHLLPYAIKVWADLCNREGQLKFGHDAYFKQWQLGIYGPPLINADYILVDEFQDSDPVLVDVLRRQNALLILVGDDAQQIFEWRGAINALKSFPGSETLYLSQSFRFGQTIADVANSILATLDEPTDLVMKGHAIPSRVIHYDSKVEHLSSQKVRAVLCRTNACAVGTVLRAVAEGKRPHLIGGGADTVAFVKAAQQLQRGQGTSHPELCLFKSWVEVQQYVKEDEGSDLKLMVKLIDEFKCEPILNALENMPAEEDADLVVSTAHKSKGREWTSVKLAADFPPANRMGDADRRLLYVAATRAQHVLDISECPPFLPGKDRDTGKEIPPIRVRFTVPMPTAADLEAFQDRKAINFVNEVEAEKLQADPNCYDGQKTGVQDNTALVPTFTWSRWNEQWCLRGPKGAKAGTVVTVTKKNGASSKETLGAVVKEFPDAVLYQVGNAAEKSTTSKAVCAECGKPGYLREDLEDGLMKHPKCCDI